jgi:hypothetical protein
MHLVPAPAVRLMKRRVQSRPGVRQENRPSHPLKVGKVDLLSLGWIGRLLGVVDGVWGIISFPFPFISHASFGFCWRFLITRARVRYHMVE